MVAHIVGVADRVEVLASDYKSPKFAKINPLGKIPVLELDDGRMLIDSPVISAYLASQGDGEKTHPTDEEAKWAALHMEALADGILDAAILVFLEQFRADEQQSQTWVDKHLGKMNAGLDALESQAPAFGDATHIGLLSLAAGLGWIEMRSVGDDWRTGRPNLGAWMDRFTQHDFWHATSSH